MVYMYEENLLNNENYPTHLDFKKEKNYDNNNNKPSLMSAVYETIDSRLELIKYSVFIHPLQPWLEFIVSWSGMRISETSIVRIQQVWPIPLAPLKTALSWRPCLA